MNFMYKRLEAKIPGTPAYYEKRKKEQAEREVFLINQQLQQLMHYTPYEFVKEHETLEMALKKANRSVVQSTILRLSYRDNFENVQVAIATVDFLQEALVYLSEEKQKKIRHTLQGLMHRLQHIDPVRTRHFTIRP